MCVKFEKKKLEYERLGNYKRSYIKSINKIVNRLKLIHTKITNKIKITNNKRIYPE